MDVTPDSERAGRNRSWILLWLLLGALTLYRLLALALAQLDLYVDEAQYWTWAQQLAWGYYSKPPVIAAVIAGTTAVCGDGVLCVKSGAPLLYLIASALVFGIGSRLFDRRVGLWSALAFALLPGVSFSALIISTDVPLAVCWAAALYCYVRALADDRWHWWLAMGAAVGVGLLTKYTMVIFGVSVLLHLASQQDLRVHLRRPRVWCAALLAMAVFAPNLWWNGQHGWPTLRHTADISHLREGAGVHLNQLLGFLAGQLGVMGPILFILFAGAVTVGAGRSWQDTRLRLLMCFSLPFLLVISLQALAGRANANWAAMTYVAGTLLTCAWALRQDHRRWLFAGLLLNALLMPLAYHLDALRSLLRLPLTAHTDPFKRVRGWEDFGATVQARLAEHPSALLLGDDREVLAEAMYYARPHPLDAVRWNPSAAVDDHYALTTTMNDKIGRDFVYVTSQSSLPAAMAQSFVQVSAMPAIRIPVDPGYERDFQVYWLQQFRGYPR